MSKRPVINADTRSLQMVVFTFAERANIEYWTSPLRSPSSFYVEQTFNSKGKKRFEVRWNGDQAAPDAHHVQAIVMVRDKDTWKVDWQQSDLSDDHHKAIRDLFAEVCKEYPIKSEQKASDNRNDLGDKAPPAFVTESWSQAGSSTQHARKSTYIEKLKKCPLFHEAIQNSDEAQAVLAEQSGEHRFILRFSQSQQCVVASMMVDGTLENFNIRSENFDGKDWHQILDKFFRHAQVQELFKISEHQAGRWWLDSLGVMVNQPAAVPARAR